MGTSASARGFSSKMWSPCALGASICRTPGSLVATNFASGSLVLSRWRGALGKPLWFFLLVWGQLQKQTSSHGFLTEGLGDRAHCAVARYTPVFGGDCLAPPKAPWHGAEASSNPTQPQAHGGSLVFDAFLLATSFPGYLVTFCDT